MIEGITVLGTSQIRRLWGRGSRENTDISVIGDVPKQRCMDNMSARTLRDAHQESLHQVLDISE